MRPIAASRPGGRALRRRWLAATFLGETLGFLVPVLAVVLGADSWNAGARFVALVLAGAGEGAVLGAAQTRVLRRVLPAFPSTAWTLRTAGAASLAWAIGLAPSSSPDIWQAWPPALKIGVGIGAGLVLLLGIGTAQWTVLRRRVPAAARWIGWTAVAWLAGLTVFLLVATPLWQPGQQVWLSALIGALAGSLMALTMAAVTGRGLAHLLDDVAEGSRPPAPPTDGTFDPEQRTAIRP